MKTLICSSLFPRNITLLSNGWRCGMKSERRRQPIVIISKSVCNETMKINQQPSKKPLIATLFKALDHFICDFVVALPLHPSLDPKHVLSGNFAPVEELPPTACGPVEGSLPSCLDGGAYIRNGPNPSFIPKGPYHLFEGDGMLHMIKFSQGEATFCCRYVSTHKHTVECEMGYPFVPSIFSTFNGGLFASILRILLTAAGALAVHFDPISQGLGPANTSLAVFCGHLFALCEADLPYAINITAEGDVETLGRRDFGASEPFSRMTAHPKVDRVTGEVFAYKYGGAPPSLKFFRIDSSGAEHTYYADISMKKLAAIHDFAVTEKYAVFPDVQIVVDLWSILRGRAPVEIDAEKVARVGIIPKYAESEEEMVWVEAAGFNPLHCVNAWDEDGGDTVCMVASNPLAVDQLLENMGGAQFRLEMVSIDLRGKTMQRSFLSSEFLEYGVINPAYAAEKTRYVYASIVNGMRFIGAVKLDLSLLNNEVGCGGGDCAVASRRYGASCDGSEVFFVARDPNNPGAEEDDGFLVTYLHDNNSGESKFIVMDARSSVLDIIAAVKLPQRIPTGFHGLFLSEIDLTKLN